MKPKDMTIVICCAGMGTRLGIGTTKALVNICGKPLILHQLEMLKDFDDIRIVLGYQAEKVIEVVNEYRRDIMYVFNYDYKNTGVATSFWKGLRGARKYVVAFDGDLLANPDDLRQFLSYDNECIAVSDINTDEPVLIKTEGNKALAFSLNGEYEWPGLAKVITEKLQPSEYFVYDMLTPLLPLEIVKVRTREIDTPEDYERAVEWVKSGWM